MSPPDPAEEFASLLAHRERRRRDGLGTSWLAVTRADATMAK